MKEPSRFAASIGEQSKLSLGQGTGEQSETVLPQPYSKVGAYASL